MTRGVSIVLALLGTAGASTCHGSSPVILVDSAHSQIGLPEGKEGVAYILPATARLTLDGRQFDFSKSLYPTLRPNAVQVLIGPQRQYSAKWDSSGMVELSKETLEPMNASQSFAGLKSGDHVIVAIGEQRVDTTTSQIVLKLLWAGMIDVR
jgi:hypothetical protein